VADRRQRIDIKLSILPSQWDEARRRLASVEGGAERAAVAAINKTVAGIRTDATRLVTRRYTIAPNTARDTLTVAKATKGSLQGRVQSRGSAIPLHAFKVGPRHTSGARPSGGLRVSVQKGGGGRLGSAFMVAGLKVGGKIGRASAGVAQRLGRTRYPIRALYGPSVPAMLSQQAQLDELQQQAGTRLDKAMAHEIERLVAGYGK